MNIEDKVIYYNNFKTLMNRISPLVLEGKEEENLDEIDEKETTEPSPPPLPYSSPIEPTLSKEQMLVINKFKKGENIFLTGQGGTGKSFLIKHLIKQAIILNKDIKVTAMTGTASILLNCKATTLHSWSGIKLARGTQEEVIKSVYKNNYSNRNWKKTNVLIVDEVSMMSQKIFEIIEKLGRLIKNPDYPFGKLQVIFCGDFLQLPPVGNPDDPLTERFCFQSPIWHTVFKPENHIELTTVFRQKDPIYRNILTNIRMGVIDEDASNILTNRLYATPPPDIPITKLFPILRLVDIENQKQFEKIEEDTYEYPFNTITNHTIYCDTGIKIPKDILTETQKILKRNPELIEFEVQYLLNNSKCLKNLELKVGAFVMSTINIDLDIGICNGSQGIVIELIEINGIPVPRVKFYNDVIMIVGYNNWQSENYPTIGIEQIPLQLAWAMSIHKSQGATLKYAQMDIGNSIFTEGQVYVALSRVESLDGLFLTAFNPRKIKVNQDVLEFYNSHITKTTNTETTNTESTPLNIPL